MEDSLHNIADLIIYEDADILIVNKPVGMLSQRNNENIKSLNEYCLEYLAAKNELPPPEDGFVPSICNRLDRNTSGLVIFAKSISAARQISTALRERTIEKYYLALVKGHPRDKRMSAWLKKDGAANRAGISENPFEGAVRIETVLENIKGNERFSLLRLELVTGKPHQLRAQLSHEGFPILGDPKYGDMKLNRELKEKYGLTSQLLHAFEIRFPKLSGRLSCLSQKSFRAELPDIFERILGE
jgi:23S rRNA pseudouridine955/2504/2580 synthase